MPEICYYQVNVACVALAVIYSSPVYVAFSIFIFHCLTEFTPFFLDIWVDNIQMIISVPQSRAPASVIFLSLHIIYSKEIINFLS